MTPQQRYAQSRLARLAAIALVYRARTMEEQAAAYARTSEVNNAWTCAGRAKDAFAEAAIQAIVWLLLGASKEPVDSEDSES